MAFSRPSSLAKALAAVRRFATATLCRSETPPPLSSASPPLLSRLSSPFHSPAISSKDYHHFQTPLQLQCVSCLVQQQMVRIPRREMGSSKKLKRRKENKFDMLMQREKKVNIVKLIRKILLKEPKKRMTLLQLGKFRRDLGLTGKRRVAVLLRKFPGVFETYDEPGNVQYVRFTAAAEAQFEEEARLKVELESELVDKIRKMLMISIDKKLTIDKISHFKHDFGLPDDFQTNLIPRYPQFFKMIDKEEANTTFPVLELTFWDPLLAVSAAEKKDPAASSMDDDRPKIVIDGEEVVSTAIGRSLNFPKGLNLTRKERQVALRFHDMPYISPYADNTDLDPASVSAEKVACTTVQELLSLTIDKRTLVDHLTHLRKDFGFPKSIRATLIRHPDLFYVSFKGKRDTCFLREAYEGAELREKDAMALCKEQLRFLVEIKPIRNPPKDKTQQVDEEEEESGSEGDFEDELEGSELELEDSDEDEDSRVARPSRRSL